MTRTPICPVFGSCGGCAMQDTEYKEQLKIKKDAVAAHFARPPLNMAPATQIYSKDEYYYRNRMDFPVSPDGPGLRKKGEYGTLIHFDKCYIADPGINSIFSEVQSWFDANREKIDVFHVVRTQGTLRYATIRSSFYSGESSVTFILNRSSARVEEQKELIKAFAASAAVKNVLVGYVKHNTDRSSVEDAETLKGSAVINEKLGPFTFYYHTQGFFQSNSAVFMDIIYFIRERIRLPFDALVDLYGGVGTLGISLMDAAREVYIVDNNPLNTLCGEKNIRVNKAENVRIFSADAEKSAELGINLEGKRSCFVLDPPRNGIHRKVLKYITTVKPEKIFYVSCNYKSQAEDLKKLLELYEVKDLAVFDMFPQTMHVETVAELQLK